MDLNNFNLKDAGPKEMELISPTDGTVLTGDDGEPVTITLYGADSNPFRKAVRVYGNKKLNQKGKQKQTMEELEQTSSKLLAQITESWTNIVVNGEEVSCSEKTALQLYTDYAWIREQVDEFVNERSNFLVDA